MRGPRHLSQYFQVVRGYDTLRAGVATLPFAVVTGAMSPAAIGLMKRIGTKIVVACGLALMSTGFVVAAGVGVDSAYWGRIIASMTLSISETTERRESVMQRREVRCRDRGKLVDEAGARPLGL